MILTLCSSDIIWEDKTGNFKKLDTLLANLDYKSDLIVFPEMFVTGFTMNTSLAEDGSGVSLQWMRKAAAACNAAVVASFPFKEKDSGGVMRIYNRAFFVFPSGEYACYDKRHLFRMGKETLCYTPGQNRVVVEYKGVRFSLNICYDLRFPVWSRNVQLDYDVLLNVANFPLSRQGVIEPLVKARAIENLAYVAFVNRTGRDPEGEYASGSLFVDYKGNNCGEEIELPVDNESFRIIKGEIDLPKLKEFREKFPAWMDADDFTLLGQR